MLATSGEIVINSEYDLKACGLLPYWKQDDLENLAAILEVSKEGEVDTQYFVSGGNLGDFLSKTSKTEIALALKHVTTAKQAAKLLTGVLSDSDEEIGIDPHPRSKGFDECGK